MNKSVVSEASSAESGTYMLKVLATVAVGVIMATLDVSITNIAFPALTEIFEADLTKVMWVALVYVLVSCSSMLLVGRVSDIVGKKRIYLLGTAIFTLGLLLCSVSRSIEELILWRAFQAVGAAMTVACGPALVTEAFPSNQLGKGLGFIGIAVSFGFVAGPVLGGLLLEWLDWRAIFYVRLPIGVVSFFMALFLLKEGRGRSDRLSLDIAGTLTSSAGMFCFVLGVSQIRRYGIQSPLVHILIGAGIALILLFVWIERRTRDPIIDLSLFDNRTFSSAAGALFLIFIAAPSYILLMPFYLMQGVLLSPSGAGLLLAVHSLTSMVFGPVSGWLSDRFGPYRFATMGAAALTVSFFIMRSFALETPPAVIAPVLFLSGAGVGAFQAPNNSTIMGGVPRNRLGIASALIATLRQVGISIGMAIAGTVYAARQAVYEAGFVEAGLTLSHSSRHSIPPAFHDVLLISAIIGVLVTLLCVISKPAGPGGEINSTTL